MDSRGDHWLRFAVECDVPVGDDGPQRLAERCRVATAAARDLGSPVRFLRCVHLPEQSAAVLLFEATDAASIAAVTERALRVPAAVIALGGRAEADDEGRG